MGKEVKQWITVNGVHVPIFEGESKEDAVKNYLSKRKAEAGKKKSGNTYDEMGKKVEENRKKMGNASPEEKRKLINENHDLMTKMDQTMQNAKLKPVKKETVESLQEEYNKLHERLGYVHERSTIAGINSRLDEISKKLNKKLQEEKKSGKRDDDLGNAEDRTDRMKIYRDQLQEVQEDIKQFESTKLSLRSPDYDEKLAALKKKEADLKGWFDRDAEKFRAKKTGSPSTLSSNFKSREEAEEFYKNKFAGVSATYANKMAKKLGIEGRGKDKREALAKHYADQWETSSNMSKNEDEKERQIARNQQEANNAQSQNTNKPNQPEEKKLPKYSNEQGYILSSTVQADSRYENIKNAFEEFKSERKNYKTGGYEMRGNGFLADDFLRGLMKKEEKGETSGEMTVNVWNEESLRDKMKAYRAALKAAGYRVVSSDNDDRINHGYMGARGRRVYSSRERARTLHYEKISK